MEPYEGRKRRKSSYTHTYIYNVSGTCPTSCCDTGQSSSPWLHRQMCQVFSPASLPDPGGPARHRTRQLTEGSPSRPSVLSLHSALNRQTVLHTRTLNRQTALSQSSSILVLFISVCRRQAAGQRAERMGRQVLTGMAWLVVSVPEQEILDNGLLALSFTVISHAFSNFKSQNELPTVHCPRVKVPRVAVKLIKTAEACPGRKSFYSLCAAINKHSLGVWIHLPEAAVWSTGEHCEQAATVSVLYMTGHRAHIFVVSEDNLWTRASAGWLAGRTRSRHESSQRWSVGTGQSGLARWGCWTSRSGGCEEVGAEAGHRLLRP